MGTPVKALHTEHLAMLAVAYSGLAWGVFWIPLRALDEAGIAGVWAIVMFYLLPTAILSPVFILRRHSLARGGWSLHAAGLLAGASLVLYAGALVFTDVVRALIFYYLTPIWSTLLARIVLGEVISPLRWGTIALGAVGLALLLRFDTGQMSALNIGDWMGLASGVLWAMAAVGIKSDSRSSGTDFALCYFLWGSLAAVALVALPLQGAGQPPDLPAVWSVLPWLVPVALVLVIPPAFAIMWGATILSPGFLSILFMTEISAGTITAALWANEPFGWREILGVCVITSAGLLEPVANLVRTRRR